MDVGNAHGLVAEQQGQKGMQCNNNAEWLYMPVILYIVKKEYFKVVHKKD